MKTVNTKVKLKMWSFFTLTWPLNILNRAEVLYEVIPQYL